MNLYRFLCHQPVYHNGEFSHNLDRDLKIYAPNMKAAEEYYQTTFRKEAEVTYQEKDLTISVGREFTYLCHELGTVEIDITLKFIDSEGRLITSDTTVDAPWKVVSSLTHWLDSEKEMFPFSVEAKEVIIPRT